MHSSVQREEWDHFLSCAGPPARRVVKCEYRHIAVDTNLRPPDIGMGPSDLSMGSVAPLRVLLRDGMYRIHELPHDNSRKPPHREQVRTVVSGGWLSLFPDAPRALAHWRGLRSLTTRSERHWPLIPSRRQWRELRKYCQLAGVPVVCPHGLRSRHSTLAIEQGPSKPWSACLPMHAPPPTNTPQTSPISTILPVRDLSRSHLE